MTVRSKRWIYSFLALSFGAGSSPVFARAQADVPAESDAHRDLGKQCLSPYIGDKAPPNRPYLEWAHFYLGKILALEGDSDGARAEYSSALRIVPDFDPAARALKKLPKRRP